MRAGFARLPPLPHCPICLFNPGHYPGPGPGSAKCDLAPLIASGGCAVLPRKPGWCSREGSLPDGAGPAPPRRSGPTLPTTRMVHWGLGTGGASWPSRYTPPPQCLGTESPFLLVAPHRPPHSTAALAHFCNLDHQADFSLQRSLFQHSDPGRQPCWGLQLPPLWRWALGEQDPEDGLGPPASLLFPGPCSTLKGRKGCQLSLCPAEGHSPVG